jgi:hypothetical protein
MRAFGDEAGRHVFCTAVQVWQRLSRAVTKSDKAGRSEH